MAYHRRRTRYEESLEGLFWLIDLSWKFGIVLVIGCFGGFLYTLPGGFRNLDAARSSLFESMFPTIYPMVHPVLSFALPIFWLLLGLVFAWASQRSWIKEYSESSRWD